MGGEERDIRVLFLFVFALFFFIFLLFLKKATPNGERGHYFPFDFKIKKKP